MMNDNKPTTISNTVFTRHSEGCAKVADRYWRKCRRRKSIYILKDGKTTLISAKTRSWKDAEEVAEARDPEKRRLQEIEDERAQWAELQKGKNITVSAAIDRRAVRSRQFLSYGRRP